MGPPPLIGRCMNSSPDANFIQSDLFILNENHLKACPVLTYVFLCLSHSVPIYVLFAGQSSQTQNSHVISSTARAPTLRHSGHCKHRGSCLRSPHSHTLEKSDPFHANLNLESSFDLKFSLYALVALHLSTAIHRQVLIFPHWDSDTCKIWP